MNRRRTVFFLTTQGEPIDFVAGEHANDEAVAEAVAPRAALRLVAAERGAKRERQDAR